MGRSEATVISGTHQLRQPGNAPFPLMVTYTPGGLHITVANPEPVCISEITQVKRVDIVTTIGKFGWC
ncbi:hypothetical protein Y032_0105g3688 [Ancylostoma ceylanicum]|uniref:Uncharacterized protein n=1 Tax=Ancylostoma ceylanicum TaxID=53326 RepID=A0A016TG44_9BILA|nr:hypothetical protein Y032_0105g3688 [Ancylostoma ceylanicum]